MEGTRRRTAILYPERFVAGDRARRGRRAGVRWLETERRGGNTPSSKARPSRPRAASPIHAEAAVLRPVAARREGPPPIPSGTRGARLGEPASREPAGGKRGGRPGPPETGYCVVQTSARFRILRKPAKPSPPCRGAGSGEGEGLSLSGSTCPPSPQDPHWSGKLCTVVPTPASPEFPHPHR